MAHFPNRTVYSSHSMALASLPPFAPVQQVYLHMGIADANTLLHCSLHGMRAGSVHPNGRRRGHPGTTEQSSAHYTHQTITPETARGRMATHHAASTRSQKCAHRHRRVSP